MTRVYIDPTYFKADNGDGGIRRVTEAMHRYLPAFGVTPVMDADDADVINCHGASLTERPGVPMVASCHGLYWDSYEWPPWAHEVNARVVDVLARGIAHTAPSVWVAGAMARGMFVYPEVIYHGVDAAEWAPLPDADTEGYVLWNKAREDPVSDPADMNRIAELLPAMRFLSTFGRATGNVRVTGRVVLQEMRGMVQRAGVYLATARETFGIGTLEAMAAGVPVAGWDWGGQSEIVTHGETGYLAVPGDYKALADCVRRCSQERARLGANARADALARWSWEPRVAQYAALFQRVHTEHAQPRPRVSVIVTCHNLAHYLPDALASVLAQTMPDLECIVVDDASGDNTPQVALEWSARDARFRYERTPHNLKLPGALNYGWQRARGRYVLNLDADNTLDPLALETLAGALDRDAGIHIAYGHLAVAGEDLSGPQRTPWPFPEFDWRRQMGHLNSIPSTALVRREVYERSGGYRNRVWRAEDAEFWSRATSFGFRAQKVTQAVTFTYRNRSDSKSKSEDGDGNWLAWMPWGYAATGPEGAARYRGGKGPRLDLVPWGAQGPTPATMRFWHVPDHATPYVSVIIPVGPGHEQYVIDALDSLVAQVYQDWEVIVVYDTEVVPDRIAGAPYARIYHTKGGQGPGTARNVGALHARGEVLYFLDADDYLLPVALEKMVQRHRDTGHLVYGDWLRNDQDGKGLTIYEADDFQCGAALKRMQHSTNMLIPRAAHEKIGGFDQSMLGWEDWDYCIAAQAVAGLCSERIAEPLFVYRFRAGTRRESSFALGAELKGYIRHKWRDYYEGRRVMGCGCNKAKATNGAGSNGSNGAGHAGHKGAVPQLAAHAPMQAQDAQAAQNGMVWLEYVGTRQEPHTIQGPATGRYYRFGLMDGSHKLRLVQADDATQLLTRSTGGKPQFRYPLAAAEPVPVDAPAPPQEFTGREIIQETRRQEWPTMDMDDIEPGEIGAMGAHPSHAAETKAIVQDAPVAITSLTLQGLRARIAEHAVDPETLALWLAEERAQGKPRQSVVAELTKALSRIQEPA